jgi:hypothetical protein
MNKQLETWYQRRIKCFIATAVLWSVATLISLLTILDEAQQDPILERMILEMNEAIRS